MRRLLTFTLSLFPLQATEKFIPSYETVSFAVKSIAQQLNWTEAVLLATGKCHLQTVFAGVHSPPAARAAGSEGGKYEKGGKRHK